jgi:hypothetical protein
MSRLLARDFLESEAISLITRLEQVQPFSLSMPMVAAASVSDEAFRAISDHLLARKHSLRAQVHGFVAFLKHPYNISTSDTVLQANYAALKLRFNAILDQFDIFADVINQRAEHKTGVWIAGLDILAQDALQLAGNYYEVPPVMCFLERGHGAAIRRARTRLPGGDTNPVAIIQVPRERMVGSGIAASLIHEVGHQGAALLDLVSTIRREMNKTPVAAQHRAAWSMYHLWLSEILADFWAMGHLGIGASLGLMGVVSLPRYFMFRHHPTDPHPFPWIRVKISLAFGEALFPHPQWAMLQRLWHQLHPLEGLSPDMRATIAALEGCMPQFTTLVSNHRNKNMKGKSLVNLFPITARQPATLKNLYQDWLHQPKKMTQSNPSLIFAVIGQARADSLIDAESENKLLSRLLRNWAWYRAEDRLVPHHLSPPSGGSIKNANYMAEDRAIAHHIPPANGSTTNLHYMKGKNLMNHHKKII